MAIQAAVAMFLIYVVYRDALVSFLPFEIVMSAILGYLAFLHHRLSGDSHGTA
jgi:hypothetical protein